MKGRAIPLLSAMLLGAGAIASEAGAQGAAPANVVRVKYERYPEARGRSFGAAGPFERIIGTLLVEADPNHPGYREIVDIDKAPRNAAGRVEYEAEFILLRPVDPAKANGTILTLVPNRGNPTGADGVLMGRGYTILNVAWQGDVLPTWAPARPGSARMLFKAPIATDNGKPITGKIRVNYLAEEPFNYTLRLGDGPHSYLSHDGYEAVSTDNSGAVLTMRANYWDERQPIPNSDWSFAFCPYGSKWGASPAAVAPNSKYLCVPAGLKTGWIYELIYEAKNPKVLGLGLASTRDALSFFRFSATDADGTPNPLFVNGRSMIQRAIVGGSSQTGRYTRQYLHMGFHVDAEGRVIAEGIWPNVCGGRLPINLRFASPSQGFLQHMEEDFPSYEFPIAWNVMEDPYVPGRMDGVLKRCLDTKTCPKIIHTVSGSEYWNERVSIVTTEPGSAKDLALPDNIRFFLFASTPHNRTSEPMFEELHGGLPMHKQLTNNVSFGEHTRALLVALDEWIREGKEPPASLYPRVADGTLVPPDRKYTGFPEIPGVLLPHPNEHREYDYGPEYRSKGIISLHPPKLLPRQVYRTLVPKVDADGIDIAGVHPLAMMVPTGTYTGWNLRSKYLGAENELWRLRGSYIPFAATKEERLAKGDPRLSLEERYGSREGYLAKVRTAAAELVAKRYVLPEDAQRLVTEAERNNVMR